MASRQFIPAVLAIALALCALAAAFTYTVDPYGLRLRETLVTNNWMFHHIRLTRPHQLKHMQGSPLILGSSRVARMRPGEENGTTGFSSAVPGATPYELLRFLQHAHALGHAQQVLIGLDFSSFLDNNPAERFGFEEARMLGGARQPAWKRLRRQVQDMHRLQLSGRSLVNAGNKVLGRQGRQLTMYRDGTWAMAPGRREVPRKGKFLQIGEQYFDLALEAGNTIDLITFREMVAFCHENKIDAVFYVSPVHHFLLSAYDSAGKLTLYQDWQAQLLQVLEQEATAASAATFPLYGFQQDWAAVAETVAKEPASPAYLDGLHASFSYGDSMREQLLGGAASPGQTLSADNFDRYWHGVLEGLARYQERDKKLLRAFSKKVAR